MTRFYHLCVLLMIMVCLGAVAVHATDIAHSVERGTVEVNDELLSDSQIEDLGTILDAMDSTMHDKEIGLVASRWSNKGEMLYRIRYNDEEVYPIASTFKALASYYYFMNTPEDEWDYELGTNIYSMVIYSNNSKTGNLLYQVAQRIPGDRNPIEKFNDFTHKTFGLSEKSGIYAWSKGALDGSTASDARYAPYPENPDGFVELHGTRYITVNRFTAADLAKATEMIANLPFDPNADPKMLRAAMATRFLMTIKEPLYPTHFDNTAHILNSWRKYGYLDVSELGTVSLSETVVIPTVDGGHIVLSMLSAGERGASFPLEMERVWHLLAEFDHAMTGPDLPDADFSDVPEGKPQVDRFNYGYVIPAQMSLYSAPDTDADPIANPWRLDMTYPVAVIPQGALVRYTMTEDSKWGKLVFNKDDETFTQDVYIDLDDVYTVSDEAFTPIQVTDSETPPDKFILIDKPSSTLALFENDQLILKTPVLLNVRRTGEGQRYILNRSIDETRYEFPFVSLVSTYGESGQAFYSAPWEWWTETVVQDFDRMRYTDGNIRLPNWIVDIPGYGETRIDLFMFRWMGGFTNPATDLTERATQPVVRVYGVREKMNELYGLGVPGQVRNMRKGWEDIIETFTAAPLNVPDSYYEASTYTKPE
jgi:hypothetical protein